MNSRQRVLASMNHQEPDRVPFDLGGSGATGIHKAAYGNIRKYLGLPEVEIRTEDIIQQLAVVDEDLAERLETDCRNVAPRFSVNYNHKLREEDKYYVYTDEWEIDWRMPKECGLYYDMFHHPLKNIVTIDDMANYTWPDSTDPRRFEGLRQRAKVSYEQGKIVILGGLCSGVTEMHSRLRGFLNYYTDFLLNPSLTEYLMDKVVELKMDYWKSALASAGEYADIVLEADDMAGQERLLISPHIYRKYIKPRHTKLFTFIKQQAPVKIFFHTCGAIKPLIGDLIEAGIDILNPVQKSAKGMDLIELKKEYGADVVFWGGGVDTQHVFSTGTPDQVRQDVQRSIDALAPGGGFIFATVHNTQADVPPENFLAMWDSLQEFGKY